MGQMDRISEWTALFGFWDKRNGEILFFAAAISFPDPFVDSHIGVAQQVTAWRKSRRVTFAEPLVKVVMITQESAESSKPDVVSPTDSGYDSDEENESTDEEAAASAYLASRRRQRVVPKENPHPEEDDNLPLALLGPKMHSFVNPKSAHARETLNTIVAFIREWLRPNGRFGIISVLQPLLRRLRSISGRTFLFQALDNLGRFGMELAKLYAATMLRPLTPETFHLAIASLMKDIHDAHLAFLKGYDEDLRSLKELAETEPTSSAFLTFDPIALQAATKESFPEFMGGLKGFMYSTSFQQPPFKHATELPDPAIYLSYMINRQRDLQSAQFNCNHEKFFDAPFFFCVKQGLLESPIPIEQMIESTRTLKLKRKPMLRITVPTTSNDIAATEPEEDAPSLEKELQDGWAYIRKRFGGSPVAPTAPRAERLESPQLLAPIEQADSPQGARETDRPVKAQSFIHRLIPCLHRGMAGDQ